MLADRVGPRREVLGAFPYQPNEVVLHTDTSVLPRRRRGVGELELPRPAGRAASAPP